MPAFAKQPPSSNLLLLAPLAGTVLFGAFYVAAARLYPGGSQANRQAAGFSWVHNYWCNLLSSTAINGQPNPARPVAIAGMLVLCVSLGWFWHLFTRYVAVGRVLRLLVRGAGTLAVTAAFCLFTPLPHNLLTNLASLLGLVALVGVFIGLRRANWRGLFWFGLANLLLVVANNVAYYTPGLLVYLPVVQKISFVSFLAWMCGINLRLFRQVTTLNFQ